MKKIYYYYDPLLKSNDDLGRFAVDYYCTDGKVSVWAGRVVEDYPTAALYNVRKLVNALNEPRPFWGWDGKIMQWIWWVKRKNEL